MNEKEKLISIFSRSINGDCMKKTTFSKAHDKEIVRSVARIFATKDGKKFVQVETFTKDNKALHKNFSIEEAPETLASMALCDFDQTAIVGVSGQCDIKISKKGKIFISDKLSYADKAKASSHDREKKYLLSDADFLKKLGVCGENGKILDKKQSKFRQINRFVELLDDVYSSLPSDGELTVCDLCCGKSYLTFAVYFYLTKLKGRKIKMYGVDLKKDVIEYCSGVARELGYSGLEFICADINTFRVGRPDLVISLHACDIATDIVLSYAIRNSARVILSTPCCHHEMMNQLSCGELEFISEYSMLRQKLCDAATDSLRCLMLKSSGYSVEALELIDPEDTPKNLLIRAVQDPKMTEEKRKAYRSQYDCAVRFLGVSPYLLKITDEGDVK